MTKFEGRIRFCAFDSYDGIRRTYICSIREYCCTLGCCISSGFSFYQLWYFWSLLLLIVLLCSGGGWWFRWRQSILSSSRRSRHGRHQRREQDRVHPNRYYTGPENTTRPGYQIHPEANNGPPSYNEVVSDISKFPIAQNPPTIEDMRQIPLEDYWMGSPPPSYDMLLDLKREEEEDRNIRKPSAKDRIRGLLGLLRPRGEDEVGVPFTISREGLPEPPPAYNDSSFKICTSESNLSTTANMGSQLLSLEEDVDAVSRSEEVILVRPLTTESNNGFLEVTTDGRRMSIPGEIVITDEEEDNQEGPGPPDQQRN